MIDEWTKSEDKVFMVDDSSDVRISEEIDCRIRAAKKDIGFTYSLGIHPGK